MPDWQNPPYDQDADESHPEITVADATGWPDSVHAMIDGEGPYLLTSKTYRVEEASHVSHPDWMQRGLLAILGLILAFLVFTAGYAAGHKSRDPFTQDGFPCQEDEVLGYSPAFGPDRVGCLSPELLVP